MVHWSAQNKILILVPLGGLSEHADLCPCLPSGSGISGSHLICIAPVLCCQAFHEVEFHSCPVVCVMHMCGIAVLKL